MTTWQTRTTSGGRIQGPGVPAQVAFKGTGGLQVTGTARGAFTPRFQYWIRGLGREPKGRRFPGTAGWSVSVPEELEADDGIRGFRAQYKDERTTVLFNTSVDKSLYEQVVQELTEEGNENG